MTPARVWRCLVCGYEHEGPEPPETCPVCGAGREDFEPVEAAADDAPAAAAAEDAPGRLAIVGGGIAGVSAAESARRTAPDATILLVNGEPDPPYWRMNLTRLLAGETKEDALPLHPEDWYAEQRIERVQGRATGLDLDAGRLRMEDGTDLAFDRLVLACGGRAFVPPVPGADLEGVQALRTLRDARSLLRAAEKGLRLTVVGGGILGLETAGAMARRGVTVTLLEGHPHLMPRQLPAPAGEAMADFVRGLGIDLRTGAQTERIEGVPGKLTVRLADGDRVEAARVVFAVGIRSETALAAEAGLKVQTGIVTDPFLRTSHPRAWAAGDAAERDGMLYGSWAAAQQQGRVAGMNAAGASTEFGGLPRAHTLKVLGLDMVSVGRFEPEEGDRVIEDGGAERHRRFVFREGRMVGAVLLGETSAGAAAAKAVETGRDFGDVLGEETTAASIARHLAGRGGED